MPIVAFTLLILCHCCMVLEGNSKFLKELYMEDPLLGEDTHHFSDPHDMFSSQPSLSEVRLQENFHSDNDVIEQCFSKTTKLELELKNKEQHLLSLKKKLENNKLVNVDGFYSRILYKFWSLLGMQEAESVIIKNDKAIRRHLIVQMSAADIITFKEFFEDKKVYNKIDSFFHDNFYIGHEYDDKDGFHTLRDKFNNFLHHINSFEAWIAGLWILMMIVFVWALFLFVLDTHRRLRWGRVLFMMLILAFIISCIFHWRHMIKVGELKRQIYLRERGRIEDNSKYTETPIWTRIWTRIFGSQMSSERYFENLVISPVEEISPMMVISETLSKFLLLPLADCGHHLGLFFKNFYHNIPLLWQLPATILLVLLFTISVMAYFGYGMHFLFGLVGIYPSKSEAHSEKDEHILREREENIKTECHKIIHEAKEILTCISQTAISHSLELASQTYSEAVIHNSTMVIEKKLEDLITMKFSRIDSVDKGQPVKNTSLCGSEQGFSSYQNQTPYQGKPNDRVSLQTKDKVDGSLQLRNQGTFPSPPFTVSVPMRRRRVQEDKVPRKTDESAVGSETCRELCQNCSVDAVRTSKNFCITESYDDTEFIIQVKNVFEDCTDLSNEKKTSTTKNEFVHIPAEGTSFLETSEN